MNLVFPGYFFVEKTGLNWFPDVDTEKGAASQQLLLV
jgi:hypothetical protein